MSLAVAATLRLLAAVTYDPARLVVGLCVAVALLLTAAWLARSTDWHPPTEADTPALDESALDDSQ
ncbi:MAG TPA: hypothetical protein VG478_08935 [Acidimicrobiales bacterium]|nr:hypothetical protein [Acidimicrobiales bacterium]